MARRSTARSAMQCDVDLQRAMVAVDRELQRIVTF
jgi:hypothetical protein